VGDVVDLAGEGVDRPGAGLAYNADRSGGRMPETYDVAIVGSGASGGWVAKELTEAGLRVAVLEAGRQLDPKVDYADHKKAYELPLRGELPREQREAQPIQKEACDAFTSHLFVNDHENPYTTPADKPFKWFRGRHVGGKSITWGRQTYRLSDYDFKAASRDGFGVDWPLDYAELAPYYDRVERFIGVSGQAEGLPQLPDGRFQRPMNLTCGEQAMRQVAKAKFGRTLTIGRCAILTEPLPNRPACHYCGPCERGCSTGSYYSSPSSSLPAAAATGRLTVVPDAVVSHLESDAEGRCRSVAYFDRRTRAAREVFAKAIVLCASTLESTRILLNSRSARHPAGLGNSSGVLGHYLMDHIMGGGAFGELPAFAGQPDERANRPNGIYLARFRNLEDKHPDFIRGYGYQGGANLTKWQHAHGLMGFGKDFKRRVRTDRAYWSSYWGFGECLPVFENHVRLDEHRRDAWGIPALHISMAFGDNERKMCKDMSEQAAAMLEASGARSVRAINDVSTPGAGIHEVGTARMGNDPKTSVVNRWQQAHDVKNLFLMDGAVYPSSACQNPTITIMALASRACAHLVEDWKKGEI
jgi:choline dehydrogenase-like flavoprotein